MTIEEALTPKGWVRVVDAIMVLRGKRMVLHPVKTLSRPQSQALSARWGIVSNLYNKFLPRNFLKASVSKLSSIFR